MSIIDTAIEANRSYAKNYDPTLGRQPARNQPTAGREQMIQASRKRWGQSTGFPDKETDRRML